MARLAILLRQIAYANRDGFHGRQVFIVSHHEEMSNHLVEFLMPPEGRKLRIVKFTDWIKDSGPEISEFEVRPADNKGLLKDEVTNQPEYGTIIRKQVLMTPSKKGLILGQCRNQMRNIPMQIT